MQKKSKAGMRYKHKQSGNIAVLTHSGNNYRVSNPQNYTIPKWIVENSSEWEELKEDPTIEGALKRGYLPGVKVRCDFVGSTYEGTLVGPLYTTSSGIWSKIQESDLAMCICSTTKKKWATILTKSNLPPGTVIKDYLNSHYYMKLRNGKWASGHSFIEFTIDENQIGGRFTIVMTSFGQPKTKLFTTEDGVDIFEGDKYYWVATLDDAKVVCLDSKWKIGENTAIANRILPLTNNYKHFSTKQAAQQFVDENVKKYSLSDLRKVCMFPIAGQDYLILKEEDLKQVP